MKKSVVLLAVVALVLTFGMSAMAAPVTPNGLTVTQVMDFNSLTNGTTTLGALGFWFPDGGDSAASVSDGVVTIDTTVWGAFPSLTADQQALYSGKTGLGFFFKAGAEDATICAGFNANTEAGTNYTLTEGKTVLLAAKGGTVTEVTTYQHSGFNQGAIDIPANFEGYIYIPFSTYISNNADKTVFDSAAAAPATMIYVIGAGAPVSYGEFVAYTGTYTPTDNPKPNPGDFSVVLYAATAVAALGGVTLIRRKK